MSKYICICGDKFKTKTIADVHLKIRENDPHFPHKIFISHWQVRLLDLFFSIDIVFWLSVVSAIIINSMFLFHSNWGALCKITESVCVGFVLARLLEK